MFSRIMFFSARILSFRGYPSANAVRVLAILIAFSSARAAQAQAPGIIVGEIEGGDVTVENGPAVPAETRLVVGSGSVVTVHTGHAQLLLQSGGRVDICGPAKFATLASDSALTLALDFGTVRLQMRGARPVKIYTPQIMATPIAIAAGPRDVTMGLDLNGALCVFAAQGALRLEQQFTGDGLIVPELGEFLLPSGKLALLAALSGACRCTETQDYGLQPERPSLPERGMAAPPTLAPHVAAEKPGADVVAQKSRSAAEFSVPAHVNTDPPHAPAAPSAPAEPPEIAQPIWKVIMPPLVFSAKSPALPPEPDPQTMLLVREIQVEPGWIFRTTVEEEPVDAATRQKSAARAAANQSVPHPRRGFWGWLKRVFGGGSGVSKP